MMRKGLPPRLRGDGPNAAWLNQLRDHVEMITPLVSPNRRLHATPHGTFDLTDPQQAAGEAANEWFKGSYVPDRAYSAGNVVVVRGGPTRGTYVASRDVPANINPQDPPTDPAQGIYWIKISNGDSIGQWT